MIPLKQDQIKPKPVIEFPPWIKLIVCMGLSVAAFATQTPPLLFLLLFAETLVLILFMGWPDSLRQEAKMFLSQTAIICLLYGLRFGFPEALAQGLTISAQLFLAFYPGLIFVQSTPQSRIVHLLSRIMPDRFAFVLATSLKFVPTLFIEIRRIYEIQALRGARVLPRDLIKPWKWIRRSLYNTPWSNPFSICSSLFAAD